MDDVTRSALTELIGWMHEDYVLSKLDALHLLSKVVKIHVGDRWTRIL